MTLPSSNTSQTVHNLDAYILILPLISPKTLPGGRGRVSSTITSSGWSAGLRLSYISSSSYTLAKSLFRAHLNYTVWDISMECRRGDVSRQRIIWRLACLRHVWSCGFIAQCGLPDIYRAALAGHSNVQPVLDIGSFKLCAEFRCLNGSSPPYLVRYFTPVSTIASWCSHLQAAATGALFLPRSQTLTIDSRALAISSFQHAWNCLPVIFFSQLDGCLELAIIMIIMTYIYIILIPSYQ